MSATDIVKLIFSLPEKQQWKVVMSVLDKLQVKEKSEEVASPGTPMSMELFKKRIAKSEEDILNGKVYSSEEVLNRLKSWK